MDENDFSADYNAKEVTQEEAQENSNGGSSANYSSGLYYDYDAPEKSTHNKPEKKKKKRPLIIRILVALISLVLSGLLLITFVGLFAVKVIGGVSYTKGQLLEPFESVKVGNVQTGKLFNSLDIGLKFDDDATLAECMYRLLPPQLQGMTNADEIAVAINESDKFIDFFAKQAINYGYVAIGAEEVAYVSSDEVIELLHEYDKVVAKSIGRESAIGPEFMVLLEKGIKKTKIDEATRFTRSDMGYDENPSPIDSYEEIKETAVFGLIAAAIVIILLLLVLDLHRKRRVLLIISIVSLLTALCGLITLAIFDMFIDEAVKRVEQAGPVIKALAGNAKNSIVNSTHSFWLMFLGFLAAYVALRIVPRIMRKRKNAAA